MEPMPMSREDFAAREALSVVATMGELITKEIIKTTNLSNNYLTDAG